MGASVRHADIESLWRIDGVGPNNRGQTGMLLTQAQYIEINIEDEEIPTEVAGGNPEILIALNNFD